MHGREITPSPSEHPAEQNGFMTHASMYEIAGYGPLTERSVKRYLKDKEQDEEIQLLANISSTIDRVSSHILDVPIEQRAELVIQGLEHPDPTMQTEAARMIWSVDVYNYVPIFEKCLGHSNPDVMKIATKNIHTILDNLPMHQTIALLKRCLTTRNPDVLKNIQTALRWLPTDVRDTSLGEPIRESLLALLNGNDRDAQLLSVDMIRCIPEGEQTALLDICLAHHNPDVQEAAARIIESLARDQLANRIEKCLEHPNPKVQRIGATLIINVPIDERGVLREKASRVILTGLQSDDPTRQAVASEMIWAAPKSKRAALGKLCLEHPNPNVQPAAVALIEEEPADERTALIEKYLGHPNPNVQDAAIWVIRYAPENQRASLIMKCLEHPNLRIRVDVLSHIESTNIYDRAALLKHALNDPHSEVRLAAAKRIWQAKLRDRPGLFKIARQQLGDRLVEPPLYQSGMFTDDTRLFPRKAFRKTGSETTLVGGSLKGKTIVRHITPKAFLAWQSLFENYSLWEHAGFDYVPIEPIESYRLKKNGIIDVLSGVLDLNLDAWWRVDGSYRSELEIDRNKILAVLAKKKFTHGHPHEKNFCLRFFRDKNGHVDFKRKPRLYLIDFDQAISP